MGKLLFAILRFLFSNLGMLITIVVVLLVGTWAQREWQALANAQSDMERQQRVVLLLQARHQDLIKAHEKTEKASQKLLTQVEHYKKLASQTQTQLQQLRDERQALWDEHWVERKNPMSAISQELREYDIKIAALSARYRLSQQALTT